MSDFWSLFVIVLAVGNILAMLWLLIATSRNKLGDEAKTTGHQWDGIEELNNPLPRWWLWLFVITIIFSFVYLYFYPGLGNYAGSLGWSQTNQFEKARDENRAKQSAFFAEFEGVDIPTLAQNTKAMRTGERLFANNCATCHGSDGRGAKGFPNLTDDDWLYGSDPQTILTTLRNGRAGVMPNLNLSESHIAVLAEYVQYLAGGKVTDFVKEKGAERFVVCAACHGIEGKGNQALGAPNLTDSIWLHGQSTAEISYILRNGKQGNMPSFSSILSPDEIRLLAAYVTSLASESASSGAE
jgi:cytochrome c oxidase cbb3-type subunit 3